MQRMHDLLTETTQCRLPLRLSLLLCTISHSCPASLSTLSSPQTQPCSLQAWGSAFCACLSL